MKKKMMLVAVLVLAMSFSGCDQQKDQDDTPNNKNETAQDNKKEEKSAELKIEDYFPMRADTQYEYEGSGNEFASYKEHVDYIENNKFQRRVDNGGRVVAEVIEVGSGEVKKILSRPEMYYRENLIRFNPEEEDIILKAPIKVGTEWNVEVGARKITSVSADVSTPSGKYKAIEVVTKGDSVETTHYYAKGVGLVKSVFKSEGSEVSSVLKAVKENTPLVQEISFYYPNLDDDKIYEVKRDISFKTNEITRQVIAEAYKEVIGKEVGYNLGRVLSPNAKINSLYLNADGMVYIDLNGAFLTEMNAGALYESMILQSMVNTIGKYYGVERVMLTIEEQPYSSGHIEMGEDEYMTVNYEGIYEIQE